MSTNREIDQSSEPILNVSVIARHACDAVIKLHQCALNSSDEMLAWQQAKLIVSFSDDYLRRQRIFDEVLMVFAGVSKDFPKLAGIVASSATEWVYHYISHLSGILSHNSGIDVNDSDKWCPFWTSGLKETLAPGNLEIGRMTFGSTVAMKDGKKVLMSHKIPSLARLHELRAEMIRETSILMRESSGLMPSETKREAQVSRNTVFICYSHKDKQFMEQLITHLKPLERSGRITHWSDRQIEPGSKWADEIATALDSALVAVLLVTKDFLASDFIHEKELGPILQRAENGGVKLLWILVRDCNYKATPLKNIQSAISPDKPLAEMRAERDRAWVRVCERINKILD